MRQNHRKNIKAGYVRHRWSCTSLANIG
ncbi:uncharacterized protein METZ01_LOCUS139038, partial [marine metagenome]